MTQQTTNISRRGFLTLGGLTALGGAAALAGCAPQTAADKKLSGTGTGTSAADVDFEEEYDVVVVGAGIAGITSAITVSREGAGASCLVIEKEAAAAGCSPVCAGDFLGRDDEYEYPVQYLKDMATTASGQTIPDDVLEAFAAGINENLEWVLSLGATMDMLDTKRTLMEDLDKAEYREFASAVAPEYSFDDNAQPPFNHLHNFLTHICVDECTEAVELRFNTPLEDLVRDGDGRVVGVIADGHAIKANKGVIMCCGGYEHNEEFLEGFCGVGNAISFAMEGNTGDGHKMGVWAGGEIEPTTHTKMIHDARVGRVDTPHLLVNAKGERFMCEGPMQGYLNNYVREYIHEAGGDAKAGNLYTIVDAKWQDQIAEWKAIDPEIDASNCKWFYEGNTIEEACAAMAADTESGAYELDAAAVQKTVDRYNELCAKGSDDDFGKNSTFMRAIDTPPFIVVPHEFGMGLSAIIGGLLINADNQVLKADEHTPIDGLFAVGNVSGCFYGGVDYPMDVLGLSIGRAITFGYVAVEHALKGE